MPQAIHLDQLRFYVVYVAKAKKYTTTHSTKISIALILSYLELAGLLGSLGSLSSLGSLG